jgi:hypothetical protein
VENILNQIEYGDLLLGMLHGFGLAMDVHPAAGTLYINARSIVECDCLRGAKGSSSVGLPRQPARQEEFQLVLDYVTENSSENVAKNISGAMAWIGDPEASPAEINDIEMLYGMIMAREVMRVQHSIEGVILTQLSHHVLLDQTNLANVVLGNPPDDAACCWLVTKWLADKLHDHTQEVVHQLGSTHWWQQEYPLTDTTNLLENPALQRVANSMVIKRW